MKKKEWVYREILHRILEKRQNFFSQKDIAETCMVSTGNVNKSLEPLESMNCIEKRPFGFSVIDAKKMLLYWASIRNLKKDVIYQTFAGKSIEEIENELPECSFTAYSGYKFEFGKIPSDYSEVLVYADKKLIEERFPQKRGKSNLIVLKPDKHLLKFKKIPVAQLFVDLWNLNTWYANEFLKTLEVHINGILE